MNTPRPFHIGDVLSITTGRLVAPSGIGGVYEILNFMTGDNLYTHQLPRVVDECRPALLAQHPTLADIEVPDFDRVSVDGWVDEMACRYGTELPVSPLAAGQHEHIDPIEELRSVTDKPIIAVVVEPLA